MADRTEIAWCDSTFNPWIGCTKVGPGCDHCYAERDMDHRRHRVKWGAGQARSRTSAAYWKQPMSWNRTVFAACQYCGWRGDTGQPARNSEAIAYNGICTFCKGPLLPVRRRVFCASLADVFDNEVDPQWRRDLFDLIRATPNLDWLLLTKRIGIAQRLFDECHDYLSDAFERFTWPGNVWLGATVVNQDELERDAPKLLAIHARIRFLSIEPMLGHMMLLSRGYLVSRWSDDRAVDWVVAGGESGPSARPMNPDWARLLRDQCAEAGVPFMFKQWGAWAPVGMGHKGQTICFPANQGGQWVMGQVGKKAAGRLLDGVQHDGYPA